MEEGTKAAQLIEYLQAMPVNTCGARFPTVYVPIEAKACLRECDVLALVLLKSAALTSNK